MKSIAYQRIAASVQQAYFSRGSDPQERFWYRAYGARWRSRVGRARLEAEEAAREAGDLIRSIHPQTFRSSPEEQALRAAALDAVNALAAAVGRENWRRYEEAPAKRRTQ